eukprot:TRINITY_DN4775_c0_g1_i1.p1 TRINITY_DN4775_c0_g1~~TRINITY_DN4775_c0_g1_i1.p1  ORF type:complete len:707 (+),score=189.32 TRINITY_DN4775_c0_g1_i1:80-2122(+)
MDPVTVGETYAAAFCRADVTAINLIVSNTVQYDGPSGSATGLKALLRLWRVWWSTFKAGNLKVAHVGKSKETGKCSVVLKAPRVTAYDTVQVNRDGKVVHIKRVLDGEDDDLKMKLQETFRALEYEAEEIERKMEEQSEIARNHLVNSRLILTSMQIGRSRRARSFRPPAPGGLRLDAEVVMTPQAGGIVSPSLGERTATDPGAEDESTGLAEDRALAELRSQLDGIKEAHQRKEQLWADLMRKKDQQLTWTLKREQAHVAKLREKVSVLVEQLEAVTAGAAQTQADFAAESKRRAAELFERMGEDVRVDRLQNEQRWLLEEFLRRMRVNMQEHQEGEDARASQIHLTLMNIVETAREARRATLDTYNSNQSDEIEEAEVLHEQLRSLRVEHAATLSQVQEQAGLIVEKDRDIEALQDDIESLRRMITGLHHKVQEQEDEMKLQTAHTQSLMPSASDIGERRFLKSENARLVKEINELRESFTGPGTGTGGGEEKYTQTDPRPKKPKSTDRSPGRSPEEEDSSDSTDEGQQPQGPVGRRQSVRKKFKAFCYMCGKGPQETEAGAPVLCEGCRTSVYFGPAHRRETQLVRRAERARRSSSPAITQTPTRDVQELPMGNAMFGFPQPRGGGQDWRKGSPPPTQPRASGAYTQAQFGLPPIPTKPPAEPPRGSRPSRPIPPRY